MKLTPANQISLHDELNSRILKSIRHLQELNTPEMRMEFTHPDEFWHWGADYMGRWIAALGLLSVYTRRSYDVRPVVDELITFQNADGSFGPFTNPHDFQEWFGMGRGLIGLLEYYQVDPDPVVLESAVRLGRYLFPMVSEPVRMHVRVLLERTGRDRPVVRADKGARIPGDGSPDGRDFRRL